MRTSKLLVVAVLAACNVEQTVDTILPDALQVGHRWDCEFDMQWNQPSHAPVVHNYWSVSFCTSDHRVVDEVDQDGIDDCTSQLGAAIADHKAPAGGQCYSGCYPHDWDVCLEN
jgi:hypothetical protein